MSDETKVAGVPTSQNGVQQEQITLMEGEQMNGNTNNLLEGNQAQGPANQQEVAEEQQENVTEGLPQSGVAVGAGEDELNEEEELDEEGLILGDRYRIFSKKGKTEGTLYYVSEDMIRILPDGVSNLVVDFPIVDGDFDPELGISELEGLIFIGKGPRLGFLGMNGFRVGQTINTFVPPNGDLGKSYTITAINEEDEKMRMKEIETGDELELDVSKGIPLDVPFFVMRIQQSAEREEQELSAEEEANNTLEANIEASPEAKAAAILGEDVEFEMLGEYELEEEYVTLREIAPEDRYYPEVAQKSELLADLISMFDATSQRNPNILKKIRILVEMLSTLKNSIIKRGRDGSPVGEETISINTLSDLLKLKVIPLGRPVLESKRVLFSETSESVMETDEIVVMDLIKTIEESMAYIETLGGIQSGEVGASVPRWFQMLSSYYKQFPLGDKYSGSGYTFTEDGEYFRSNPPDVDETQGLGILGKDKEIDIQAFITSLDYSLRRAHGPTSRPLDKGGVEVAISATKAPIKGHVLFPYRAALEGYLGAKRTGKLLDDILRSIEKDIYMKNVLEKLGSINLDEDKDANNILFISELDTDAIGITFDNYLKYILKAIVPRGPGDLFSLKADLGITEFEDTIEQRNTIDARVKQVIDSLRVYISQMREGLTKTVSPPTIRSFASSENYLANLLKMIETHPVLEEIIKSMGSRTPGYKKVDIANVATLMKYAQDYFLALVGGNQKAIERERIRFVRDLFMRQLLEREQLRELQNTIGSPPKENPCEHTAALNIIRKVKDDGERMALMVKFLVNYQGGRDENWTTCLLCKQHLICQHEVLQIQQFLHPREKQVLQKEIILHYAGGTFGTSHICRNCGLAIGELEYDTNVEFDDEGRPMMGRSVLVDTTAIEEENLRMMLGADVNKQEEIQFETAEKTEFYKIIRVICDRVGLTLEEKAYGQLVDRLAAELSQTISEKDYKALDKKMRVFTYTQFLSQDKISSAAAYLLIWIQAHVPEYTIRFIVEGCKGGFGGFPIVAEADPKSEEASPGIHYMACAISGIQSQESPWNTGFQVILDDEKRFNLIKKRITSYVNHYLRDATVQTALEKKRDYIKEILGAAGVKGRPSEKLPPNFLPRMESAEEAANNAASAPNVAEGARGEYGETSKADTWIRAANRIAKEHAIVVKGSPFSETACCFSKAGTPGEFWREANLPEQPKRLRIRHGFLRQSIFYTVLDIRPLQIFSVTPSLDIAYRVFIQLCYKGERYGKPHEFGYEFRRGNAHVYKCDWCGLEMQPKFLFPDVDKNGNLMTYEEECKASLETQGVAITEETFQSLLDQAHTNNMFKKYNVPQPENPNEILDSLGASDYPPTPTFSEDMQKVKNGLVTVGASASGPEVQRELLPFRESIGEAEDTIRRTLGSKAEKVLQNILKQPTPVVFETIRSYFLVPCIRLLTGYESETRLHLPSWYKLAPTHKTELKQMLQTHADYLNKFQIFPEDSEDHSLDKAQIKIQVFVEQLSVVLAKSSELRISRIRYSDQISLEQTNLLLKEILRIFLYGPLGQLLDPNYIPEVEGLQLPESSGNSDIFIRKFMNALLNLYVKESVSYDANLVRDKLSEAKQRENQRILSEFDRLTPEERAIQLQFKRLKIGRWNVGKGIYTYDEDMWEKNRQDISNDYEKISKVGPDGVPETGFTTFEDTRGPKQGYDIHFGDPDDM